jgi:uncharacterized protein (UPF0335 family)
MSDFKFTDCVDYCQFDDMSAEIDRLRTENATLRELVREVYEEADLGWLGTKWDERAEKALTPQT